MEELHRYLISLLSCVKLLLYIANNASDVGINADNDQFPIHISHT